MYQSDIVVFVSSVHMTFPVESVVSFPLFWNVEQSNGVSWRDPPARTSPPLNVEEAVSSVTVSAPASVVDPVALMEAIVVLAMSVIWRVRTFPAVIDSVEEVAVQMVSWDAGLVVPMATLFRESSMKKSSSPTEKSPAMVDEALIMIPTVVVGVIESSFTVMYQSGTLSSPSSAVHMTLPEESVDNTPP